MNFFVNKDDLKEWVMSQKTADVAAQKIMKIIGGSSEQDVFDTCRSIFENDDNASEVLFNVLSQYNII